MTRLSATIRARNTRLIRSSPAQYLSTRNRPESNQNEASAPTSNTHLYSMKSSISATPFHPFREDPPGVVRGRPRPRPWPMRDLRRRRRKGPPPEPRRAAGGPVAPSDRAPSSRSPSSTPARPGSAGPRGRRRSRATLPNPTRPGRRATGFDAPRAADTRPDTPGDPPEMPPTGWRSPPEPAPPPRERPRLLRPPPPRPRPGRDPSCPRNGGTWHPASNQPARPPPQQQSRDTHPPQITPAPPPATPAAWQPVAPLASCAPRCRLLHTYSLYVIER